jgi:hypothetical protein
VIARALAFLTDLGGFLVALVGAAAMVFALIAMFVLILMATAALFLALCVAVASLLTLLSMVVL